MHFMGQYGNALPVALNHSVMNPVTNCTVTEGLIGVRRLDGSGGTWQEPVGFVSPMLVDRMCSREVMHRAGERGL